MRRSLALFTVAGVLVAGPLSSRAYAQEEGGQTSGESAVKKPGGLMDASEQDRPSMLSFFVELPYYGGFGIGAGARYTLPLLKNGFISTLNDSIELEFGADGWFAFYGFVAVGIPVEGRWTFHITPEFSAYGKVGVGLGVAAITYANGSPYFYVYPSVNAGVLYKLGGIYLRAEVGVPALKLGIAIPF
jgi:hypothetical protein